MPTSPTRKKPALAVVYTQITGNYDSLLPHSFLSEDFDYVCFTDNKDLVSDIWEIRYIPESDTLSNNLKAKQYKVFPHKFLPEYEYSIHIDANRNIANDLIYYNFLEFKESSDDIALLKHHLRSCIYEECDECIRLKKDNPKKINDIREFLKAQNYPENNGIYGGPLIMRKHSSKACQNLMDLWWDMICSFTRRDQLSLAFCVYALNKVKVFDLLKPQTRAQNQKTALTKRPHNFVYKDQPINTPLQKPAIVSKLYNILFNPLLKKKAFTLLNEEQFHTAEAIAQSFIINNPTISWPYYILSKIQWKQGQYILSIDTGQKAIDLDPHVEYYQTHIAHKKRIMRISE